MRAIRHLTPRYVGNRVRVLVNEKLHPDHPWLTRTMVEILASWLRPEDVGLEWGSGRSTLWFAQRIGSLTSVEHDPAWHSKITRQIEAKGVSNVDYQLQTEEIDYVSVVERMPHASLDFCLVDGVHRDQCAVAVLHRIKPGGILVVDNCNWFLPSDSLSPSSRKVSDGESVGEWDWFIAHTRDWRSIWTSNGVTDTALWLKP